VAYRVLGFWTQGFNKWRRNPVSQQDWDNAHLTNLALDIHQNDPEFGIDSSPTRSPTSV
jgi:hypothetical protein